MNDSQDPQAQVREIDGKLVLDDPAALGMVKAIEEHNREQSLLFCKETFNNNKNRIDYFADRIKEKYSSSEVVIVIINADDPEWTVVLDKLMPNHDWDGYRDRGETPYGRGLAVRSGMQGCLDTVNKEAGDKLRNMTSEIPVVVVDYGVSIVFSAGSV